MQPQAARHTATDETAARKPSRSSRNRFAFKSDTIAHRLKQLHDAPPKQRLYWWDSTRMGFGFRVSPASPTRLLRGVYVYRYRHGGKQRVLTLGKFEKFADALSALRLAVGEVEETRRAIVDGRKLADPIDRKRANRARHAQLSRTSKVRDVVDEFLTARTKDAELRRVGKTTARPGLRDSTARQYRTMLKKDFVKLLGDRPIGMLDEADIRKVCNQAKARHHGATAARLLAAISSLFTWANLNKIVDANPAREINDRDYYTTVERNRTLNNSEIKALFKFAGIEPSAVWLALLLTLATGQRSGELLQLRLRDVDDDSLLIPAEVTKTGKPHRVPLSPIAAEIIDELRARAGGSAWLFPGKDTKAPMKQQTLGMCLRRLHKDGKLTIDFAPHDLRRTFRTQLSVLGVPELISEMILGHEVRTSVERHYSHHAFADEQRIALEKWSTKLCELRGRPAMASNVVALPLAATA